MTGGTRFIFVALIVLGVIWCAIGMHQAFILVNATNAKTPDPVRNLAYATAFAWILGGATVGFICWGLAIVIQLLTTPTFVEVRQPKRRPSVASHGSRACRDTRLASRQ